MIFDIRTRLLARVFVDAQTLDVPQDEALKFAREELGGFLLGHAVEQSADGLARERFVFLGKERDRILAILSGSFDFTMMPLDENGANLSDFPAFAREASHALSLCVEKFGRLPHRVALLQEGLLGEMSVDEMNALAGRLLHTTARSKGKNIFEWDWRLATREIMSVANRDENCNFIVTIRRGNGLLTPVRSGTRKFDRVRVDLDVNTSPDDTRGRFDGDRIKAFFDAALAAHERLSQEAEALIGGAK